MSIKRALSVAWLLLLAIVGAGVVVHSIGWTGFLFVFGFMLGFMVLLYITGLAISTLADGD